MQKERVILGIDPGTNIMGYGIIRITGNQVSLVTLGVLKLNKYEDHSLRLKSIFRKTVSLIEEYRPLEIALEAPFYGKNVQSMLKLGRAQGVAMAAALSKDIPVFEYTPRKIKQSVTGKGGASKEQVAAMLYNILNINEHHDYLDATDGLAAALCHYFQPVTGIIPAKKDGWQNFLKNNPERYISF